MARVKRAVNALKKRRKVFKLSKGYFGAKSKQYRAASEQVRRSLRYAYIGRKLKKREYRRLWIARINAAARMNGISYSRLMNGLKVAGTARCSPSSRLTTPRRSPLSLRKRRPRNKFQSQKPSVKTIRFHGRFFSGRKTP